MFCNIIEYILYMDFSPKQLTNYKFLKLFLKVAVSAACLWYVFTKIDFSEVISAVKKANGWWLIAGFIIYTISKFLGAKRLNIYFKNIDIHLPEWQNIKLYWLGMFYNLFLPGAITGDAYKVLLLSKRYTIPYNKTTAAVLLDRFSGLLSLGIIAAIYSSFVIQEKTYALLLICGSLLAIPLLYFIIKKIFPEFLPGFWPAFLLGAAVQLTMLLCVYFILLALNLQVNYTGYVFIFLIAAVASVLPISVGGGLGVREFVMIEGAKYAGLEQHTALLVSLLFYLITVICSLAGIVYVFKNPLRQDTDTVS